MLATARGLMSKPTLLLLDEPSMGLSPILVEEIFRIIVEINKQGTSILLVEQNAQMALSVAHRAYVLETGRIVLSGRREGDRRQSAGEDGVPGSVEAQAFAAIADPARRSRDAAPISFLLVLSCASSRTGRSR